jgi:peroxiredoxin
MTLGPLAPGSAATLTATQLAELDLSPYTRRMVPPDFSLRRSDGQVASLKVLRGKVVILNFWTTWCRECLAEMPALDALYRRFGGRGLTVLGINAREDPHGVERYARTHRLTFPLALDRDGAVTSRYGVIGLPTTFVIGRDGGAVALVVGPRDWASSAAIDIVERLLEDEVSQPGPPGSRP